MLIIVIVGEKFYGVKEDLLKNLFSEYQITFAKIQTLGQLFCRNFGRLANINYLTYRAKLFRCHQSFLPFEYKSKLAEHICIHTV